MPFFDLENLILTFGYLGILAITFAESGLFFGFFLPGDSLLFTAGFLASQNLLEIKLLLPVAFLGAVVGDSIGFSFGARVGRKLFNKEDSFFFRKEHLIKAEEFYEKHGGKAIVLARFMPFVRTFAPIVAGIGKMRYSRFAIFNLLGGLLWAVGVSLAGYWLGHAIPNVDRYLLPIIGLIILISVAPTFIHLLKHKDNRRLIKEKLHRIIESR